MYILTDWVSKTIINCFIRSIFLQVFIILYVPLNVSYQYSYFKCGFNIFTCTSLKDAAVKMKRNISKFSTCQKLEAQKLSIRVSIRSHSELVQLEIIYFGNPFNTLQVSKCYNFAKLDVWLDLSWECPGEFSLSSACPSLSWVLVREVSLWWFSILLYRLHLRLHGARRLL